MDFGFLDDYYLTHNERETLMEIIGNFIVNTEKLKDDSNHLFSVSWKHRSNALTIHQQHHVQ